MVQFCISSIGSSGSISQRYFNYPSVILTPYSKDFTKKLIVYVIKKFPALYRTRSLYRVLERPHLAPMRDRPCTHANLFQDSFSYYTLVFKFYLCGCFADVVTYYTSCCNMICLWFMHLGSHFDCSSHKLKWKCMFVHVRTFKRFLTFMLFPLKFYSHFSSLLFPACPILNLISLIVCGENYKAIIGHTSPFFTFFLSHRSTYFPQYPVFRSLQICFFFFMIMRRISSMQYYKTAGESVVLCILFLTFVYCKWEDKRFRFQ